MALSRRAPDLKYLNTAIFISFENTCASFVASCHYAIMHCQHQESGSLGLGLSIVEEIVTRHGDTIDFESGLAAGTTFSTSLPTD
ncbi:ATP-binding protein [Pseudomonas alliivorans]|uniref:ATP-binding protein n=1 Tax=Pseudomonas alliivorans TaxID=2810613 RepID=UPI001AE6812F|nr:ATP-binding protein [Pseudomonas alliivorans]MBP0942728.1 ATP-binding protein [Pseudomonas alliivorans]MEE4880822.1 ATP-binding protein [Pseudomonas alliivorans]MEE4937707.1 ATP-binding protein [Pseudomonas alliivorans]MEE4953220.1 ATP-binding protein [Pseudomonas alliivorans]MEE5014363.1 ATP-binding protein [Pseudomonas alliivorans]